MKKLFYVSALIFAVSLVSCAPSEVDDLFDESPAARLDNAVKNYTELLKSDGGRWLMQYFANGDEEGYNFIMTFHNDGSVDISTQNAYVNDGAFFTDRSTWDVVSDYGPVLSFNTFNKAFHVFSSPQSDGTGHGGDYEFIILDADKDKVNMRAKKSRDKGTVIDVVMTRLSSDEYPTDQDYFTELAAVRSLAFSSRINNYVLTTASGKRYICNGVTSMLWSFYPEDGSLLDNGEYMNAIITTEGIRFMQPLEFLTEDEPNQEDVIKVQEFAFQEDGSLLCTDDGATTIKGPDRADALVQPSATWTVNNASLGGDFATAYADIVAQGRSIFNQTFNWIQLKYTPNAGKFGIYFKNGRYTGNIYLDVTKVDANTVKFSFDPNNNEYFDNNGKTHYTRMTGLQNFIQLLTTGEFTLSSESVMVPNPMVFTSKSNSANYITAGF